MPKTLGRLMGALAGIIVVVIAALQNRQPVQLHLYFWILPHVPLVLLVLLAMLVGVAIGAIGMWWDRQRGGRRARLGKPSGRKIAAPGVDPANSGAASAPTANGQAGPQETHPSGGPPPDQGPGPR